MAGDWRSEYIMRRPNCKPRYISLSTRDAQMVLNLEGAAAK